jgi:sensor histidine kinase YesM
MQNINKYRNYFIVLAALVIAFLSTLPYFSSIIYSSADAEKPWMRSGFIITRSLWYLAQSFVSVIMLIYFNYSWANYLISKRLHKTIKYTLQGIYNLILTFAIIWLTVGLADITVGNPFGIKGAFTFYTWKFVYILPLAILIAYVLKLIIKSKIVEIENYKLKEESLNVQINSLKEQVNPHFLFNTLNTLSSLIRLEKKQEGLQFVDDLAKVYRYILESENKVLVRLKYELEVLQSYYFMLQKRFGQHLQIEIDIDEALNNSMIPPMVLQHLVENAIKHNIISSQDSLLIQIFNENDVLIVKNKVQPKTEKQKSLGLGLPNLIKRYKLIADKDVIVQELNNEFIVKLPIISR